MSRYPRTNTFAASFGPGPITPAVKWIIWVNVAAFVATVFYPDLRYVLGVKPRDVIERQWLWQPVMLRALESCIRTAWTSLASSRIHARKRKRFNALML